jgi:hypothetical protein
MGFDNGIDQGGSTLALRTEAAISNRTSVVEQNGESFNQFPANAKPESKAGDSIHSTTKSIALKKFRIFTILVALFVCTCFHG